MDYDVYLVCYNCKDITKASCSGDSRDYVRCKTCNENFVSLISGKFKPFNFEGPELDLYLPEER